MAGKLQRMCPLRNIPRSELTAEPWALSYNRKISWDPAVSASDRRLMKAFPIPSWCKVISIQQQIHSGFWIRFLSSLVLLCLLLFHLEVQGREMQPLRVLQCQGKRTENAVCVLLSHLDVQQVGCCNGLNKNNPHRLRSLNTWSQFGGAVWGGWGGKALLNGVHHWGRLYNYVASFYFQLPFSSSCLQLKMPVLRFLLLPSCPTLAIMPPYHDGLIPLEP